MFDQLDTPQHCLQQLIDLEAPYWSPFTPFHPFWEEQMRVPIGDGDWIHRKFIEEPVERIREWVDSATKEEFSALTDCLVKLMSEWSSSAEMATTTVVDTWAHRKPEQFLTFAELVFSEQCTTLDALQSIIIDAFLDPPIRGGIPLLNRLAHEVTDAQSLYKVKSSMDFIDQYETDK